MKWNETDKILHLDRQESLATGLAELFRRVLTEGRQRMAGRDRDWKYISMRAAAFVDYPGLSASDNAGSVQIEFGPETVWCISNNPVRYGLKSPAFSGAVPNEDWTEQEMDLVQLRLQLDLYEQVRALLATPPHRDWWVDWQAARPFPLLDYVTSGTVDLRIGEAAMGPVPEYERRLLAGDLTAEAGFQDVQALPGLVANNVVRGSTHKPGDSGGAGPTG